jgi:choline kinase
MGTRLGLNKPKALVEVGGRSMIRHHLELVEDIEDVILVVGYCAQEVMDEVMAVRRDVTFAFNHDFASTGTAASLVLGAQVAGETILSLDGDLLVRQGDFNRFACAGGPLLGLVRSQTAKPVWAHISSEGQVRELSQDRPSALEWSGLVRMPRKVAIQLGRAHVFQGLQPLLPADFTMIDSCEVDDPSDLDLAEGWLQRMKGADHG